MAKVLGTYFLHSCKARKTNNNGNAVVVSEMQYLDDGTTVPRLTIVRNPKRSFYMTKPQYRTHTEKKEIEKLSHLDQHVVADSELDQEIHKAIKGYYSNGYVNTSELLNNPYIYGADIDIQTLIKAKYKTAFTDTKLTVIPATTGFFDIEQSIDPGTKGAITIISVTHENKIYTAINKQFFYVEKDGQLVEGNVDDLSALSRSILDPMVDRIIDGSKALKRSRAGVRFETEYFIGNEIEMIRWIFKQIHTNKTSFVGIWNMNYDIPAILKCLDDHKVDHREIFCPPELPDDVKVARYHPDKGEVQHWTLKWHWMHTTGYAQFYDAMLLYSRLRIVSGKESSYALDAILQSNKMEGKLHFPELKDLDNLSKAQWHITMQRKHFYHYIVYNQADVLLIQLMEWQNTDAHSMVLLSDMSSLAKFSKQTRKVADTLYFECLKDGYVLGTPGSEMRTAHDAEISAIGGAVLSPNRMDQSGLKAIAEYPTLRTQLHPYVNDIDFSGMYPNTSQAANVSKETKTSTALYIKGEHVERYRTARAAVEVFFGYLVNPEDNAIRLGMEFFDLPGFDTMDALYRNRNVLRDDNVEVVDLTTPVLESSE